MSVIAQERPVPWNIEADILFDAGDDNKRSIRSSTHAIAWASTPERAIEGFAALYAVDVRITKVSLA